MRLLIRLFLYTAVAFLIGFGLLRFCYRQTQGFAMCKTRSALTPSKEFETPPLTALEKQDLQGRLDQPFYYLGKGAQAYVFASHDGETVLKLCRFDHLRPAFWFTTLHFPCLYERFRIPRLLQKRRRLEQEFQSYLLAFSHMRQETGLLYLHLNKGSDWKKELTLYDNIGVRHHIDLDQMEFIVQKRAQLIYPSITEWMRQGQESTAKEAISHLIALLRSRCERNIFDKDPDLLTNFGFIGTQAIQIDTGRFSFLSHKASEEEISQELQRITEPLRLWLEENFPSLKVPSL